MGVRVYGRAAESAVPARARRRPKGKAGVALVCLLGLVVAVAGCSPSDRPSSGTKGTGPKGTGSKASARSVVVPTANMTFDYQLGGPYAPPSGVRAVARDRTAPPAKGLYNICYVNAFQAQPDALHWWQRTHPDLLLRDSDGELIIDDDWNEALLDISSATKRTRLAAIVGGWIDGCARSGFQAVEPDNLDSYERSDGHLGKADNAAFAALLTDRAHTAGLAIGQKNATDLLPEHRSIGFDFAVVEECGRYGECAEFADAYHQRVFDIEYRRADFRTTCDTWGARLSVVQRDLEVQPAGTKGHTFHRC
ncbi:endo alpha-1,4 polygalactosaminidase [Streptomyces sp. NPDC048650]|uniref:endo alpha-1,4 polygalactosaminidase n=1 Tax=unclassified Streptomyces TaxID=2593676 RepID=UPI00372173F4